MFFGQPTFSLYNMEVTMKYDCNLIPFKRGDIVKVPVKRRWEQMNMDSELANTLMPIEVKPGTFISTFTGQVLIKDNKFDLKEGITDAKVEERSSGFIIDLFYE
ncbi:UNVERIFIED_CONTAM: Integrator complex subunit 9 [Trichonephila clavipes]